MLTAEHCTRGQSGLTIYAGLHYTADAGYLGSTVYTMVNKWELSAEDAAIIEVDRDIDMSGPTIGPICLPTNAGEDYDGWSATVTGWGHHYSGGTASPELYEVDVPVSADDFALGKSSKTPWDIVLNMG